MQRSSPFNSISTSHKFLALHFVSLATHIACAAYAFTSPATWDTPIDIPFTKISYSNRSESHPYFTRKEGINVSFPSVGVVHGVVAVITAFFHVFAYIPIYSFRAKDVWHNRRLSIRWIEYAFTCSLMTVATLSSSGATAAESVVSAFVGGVPLQLVGLQIERKRGDWKTLLLIVLLVQSSISVPILWLTLSSESGGSEWIETTFYLFYYSLFAVNCALDARRDKDDFVITDWVYAVLSVTSKNALFWMQVGAVERYAGGQEQGRAWPNFQVYFLGMFLPFVLLVCLVRLSPDPKNIYERNLGNAGESWAYRLVETLSEF